MLHQFIVPLPGSNAPFGYTIFIARHCLYEHFHKWVVVSSSCAAVLIQMLLIWRQTARATLPMCTDKVNVMWQLLLVKMPLQAVAALEARWVLTSAHGNCFGQRWYFRAAADSILCRHPHTHMSRRSSHGCIGWRSQSFSLMSTDVCTGWLWRTSLTNITCRPTSRRQRLCCARCTSLSTISNRAFPVAVSWPWNTATERHVGAVTDCF